MSSPQHRILPDKGALAAAIGDALAVAVREAVAERGIAHLVLTGGSMGGASLRGLRDAGLDWDRVHLWWGDERFVPAGDDRRNATEARAALLDQVAIPARNVHAVPSSDQVPTVEDAASAYSDELARFAAPGRIAPAFDVLMLGVGPDGHVASLFPGHPGTTALDGSTIAVTDSPKPPPQRVSLTFPVINGARAVWLMVSGDAKADAVAAAAAPGATPTSVPASGVHGTQETLWWLDRAAAARLPEE